MLLVCYHFKDYVDLQSKYSDRINVIDDDDFKTVDGVVDTNYPINFLEEIKLSESLYEVTIVDLKPDTIPFINAIKLNYTVVYNSDNTPVDAINNISESFNNITAVDSNHTLEDLLKITLKWVEPEDTAVNDKVENTDNKEVDTVNVDSNASISNENTDLNTEIVEVQQSILPQNKNKLTLEQLVSNDVDITDTDVRELKATQNKLKVGMLLQAKSMLNRVLKLSTILDKLYDKLLDRIDNSLETADTASLMYTAEYINKALSDTNNFMMSLINNEKIQNFFVIDNSTVINTASNDRISIDSREKVRKATEIVMNNLDFFASGQFESLINPNTIDVTPEKEDNNGNTESKSV